MLFAHFGSLASAHQHNGVVSRKMKTKQETCSIRPCQPLRAFPLFFCLLITLTFSYKLTSILPTPWTTVTNSIAVLLTDNSNEPFLFLNYRTSVMHLSSAFCFWDILLTTHSYLSWRISLQLFTFQNFVFHLLLFTCFTYPNLMACSLSLSLSLAPWKKSYDQPR